MMTQSEFILDVLTGIREYDQKHKKKRGTRKTYIMYDPSSGAYKIGRSSNPRFRETTLLAKSPQIVTLGVLDRDIEGELHQRFDYCRIRGEWFSMLSDEVYGVLDEYEFDILPFVTR